MVYTRHGALCRKSVHTQTDCPLKTAAVQVSGCRECLSLLLPPAGDRETVCVRCEQVDDLIRLVAELKEEVERLRVISLIWECEREIDLWSDSLCGLKDRGRGETPQMGWTPCPVAVGQREGIWELRRNGDRSLLDITGDALPPYQPHLPRCPYATGLRPWSLRDW